MSDIEQTSLHAAPLDGGAEPAAPLARPHDGAPEPKAGGIDSFALKLLAIIAMTCNHAAYIFEGQLPFGLRCAMLAVGGLTFPIMAFLLEVGYRHTHDVRRYGLRLLVFACISQVPYWLFLDQRANVMFTLLLGLAALWLYDRWHADSRFWLAFLVILAVSYVCDWGVLGPMMILGFHAISQHRVATTMLLPILAEGLGTGLTMIGQGSIALLGQFLYGVLGCGAAIPLLNAYNGKRGRPLKWFFYIYYPAHIALLGIIAKLIA